MDNKKIGEFITKLRKENGLTQKQLAEKLFITDKAISKWERGLSIPDIAILEKLSKEFKVEIEEILYGEKNNKNKIEIEEALEAERKKLKLRNKKRIIKFIPIIILILIFTIFLVFRNISFGYELITLSYNHTYYESSITLGVPKTSFARKQNDRSYSFKNLRNSNILKTELNNYLKTLKYSVCNDTIYYYNEEDDYSIIEYQIQDNFLYSTISYEIVERDYCYDKKVKEAGEVLGILKGMRVMTNKAETNEYLQVKLFDGGNSSDKYEFKIELEVTYIKGKQKTIIEHSYGTYEIKNNKLYYYRTNISKSSNQINIPEVSVFEIKDKKIHLIENYLSKYADEIIL